jgi:hypothetical protein
MNMSDKITNIYQKYRNAVAVGGIALAIGGAYYLGNNDGQQKIESRLNELHMGIHYNMGAIYNPRNCVIFPKNGFNESRVWQLDDDVMLIRGILRESESDARDHNLKKYIDNLLTTK